MPTCSTWSFRPRTTGSVLDFKDTLLPTSLFLAYSPDPFDGNEVPKLLRIFQMHPTPAPGQPRNGGRLEVRKVQLLRRRWNHSVSIRHGMTQERRRAMTCGCGTTRADVLSQGIRQVALRFSCDARSTPRASFSQGFDSDPTQFPTLSRVGVWSPS